MKTIEILRRTDGKAVTLEQLDSGEFLMSGAHGTHTLCQGSDPQRVHAHWEGFCQLNDVKNAAMRATAADPKRVESSVASARDYARSRYVLGMIEARIDAGEVMALNFQHTWAEAGDAQHLLAQLLQIVAPDGEKGLILEIDAAIDEVTA